MKEMCNINSRKRILHTLIVPCKRPTIWHFQFQHLNTIMKSTTHHVTPMVNVLVFLPWRSYCLTLFLPPWSILILTNTWNFTRANLMLRPLSLVGKVNAKNVLGSHYTCGATSDIKPPPPTMHVRRYIPLLPNWLACFFMNTWVGTSEGD